MKGRVLGRNLRVARDALVGLFLGVGLGLGVTGKGYGAPPRTTPLQIPNNGVITPGFNESDVSTLGGGVAFTPVGPDLIVTQTGPGNVRTIINWGNPLAPQTTGFDVTVGHTVQFVQPTHLSAVLNRDVTGLASTITGSIQANGQVYLINPAGITFGPTAVIHAWSFGASTFDLDSAGQVDFLLGFPSGVVTLKQLGVPAPLVVIGSNINASNTGGHVVLIGGGVPLPTVGLEIRNGAHIVGSYVGLASVNGQVNIRLVGTTPIVRGLYGNTHITTPLPGAALGVFGGSTVTTSQGLFNGGQIDITGGPFRLQGRV